MNDPRIQRGVPLSALARDAATLDARSFAARWAPAFLLLHGRLDVELKPSQTGARRAVVLPPPGTPLEDPTDEVRVTAYLLKRRPTSTHEFVSIGRLDGNDVALPDESVSKFHAYLKESGGALLLQDARSRNGTFVDELPVPPRGSGAPVTLVPGKAVRFGSVTTTFVDVPQLFATLRTLGLLR